MKRSVYSHTKSCFAFPNYLLHPKLSSSVSDVEAQLRSLCAKPDNFHPNEAVSLLHKAVNSSPLLSLSACNSLMESLVKSKHYELAFSVYSRMTHVGVLPSFKSLSGLIDSFVFAKKPQLALGVLGLIFKRGFIVGVYNINVILKGIIDKAMELWKRVHKLGLVPSSTTYSVMIDGFCKMHMLNFAKGLFSRMKISGLSPTLFDYNTLMASLCKESSLEQARRLFQEMKESNCEPDTISFNIMIDGTLKAGDIQSAKELLNDMQQMGLTPDAYTYSSFINRLSKLGQMEEAKGAFDSMIASGITPDNHVYDSLIKGFGLNDEIEEVINLLRQMADMGVILDLEITNSILTFLCNSAEHLHVITVATIQSHDTFSVGKWIYGNASPGRGFDGGEHGRESIRNRRKGKVGEAFEGNMILQGHRKTQKVELCLWISSSVRTKLGKFIFARKPAIDLIDLIYVVSLQLRSISFLLSADRAFPSENMWNCCYLTRDTTSNQDTGQLIELDEQNRA
ncbi:hypothetical protein D5086_018055 [Populus alba]|uniref:Uncharacterized protein n=1 Tax=Populus alba TaxID=43335 RepID=A0ACC4BNN8_POPAL